MKSIIEDERVTSTVFHFHRVMRLHSLSPCPHAAVPWRERDLEPAYGRLFHHTLSRISRAELELQTTAARTCRNIAFPCNQRWPNKSQTPTCPRRLLANTPPKPTVAASRSGSLRMMGRRAALSIWRGRRLGRMK